MVNYSTVTDLVDQHVIVYLIYGFEFRGKLGVGHSNQAWITREANMAERVDFMTFDVVAIKSWSQQP